MTNPAYRRPRVSLALFDPLFPSDLPSNDSLPYLPPLPETPKGHPLDSIHTQGIVTAFFNRPSSAAVYEEKFEGHRDGKENHLVDVEEEEILLPCRIDGKISRTSSPRKLASPSKYAIESTKYPSTDIVSDQLTAIKTFSTYGSPIKSVPIDQYNSSSHVFEHKAMQERHHITAGLRHPESPPTSLHLPVNIIETSMIQDCSFAGASGCSDGDDSLDLLIRALRPEPQMPSDTGHIEKVDKHKTTSPPKKDKALESVITGDDSRSQVTSYIQSSEQVHRLDQSTLLPSSPAKLEHLLAPMNDLRRTQPPWLAPVERKSDSLSPKKSDSTGHTQPLSTSWTSPGKSAIPRRAVPLMSSSPRITISSLKSKRTFPASTSGRSLASVGEEEAYRHGEHRQAVAINAQSCSSPEKTRHLHDKDLISKMTMFNRPDGRKSEKISPVKTSQPMPSSGRTITQSMHAADVTFDVCDLMAKINKPKRVSGTEESFADLLHGNEALEGVDLSAFGLDETFLPDSLRPRALSATSLGPAPIKQTLPASPSGHSLASIIPAVAGKSRRRSRSLSGLDRPDDLFIPRSPKGIKQNISPAKSLTSVYRTKSDSRSNAPAVASRASAEARGYVSNTATTLPPSTAISHKITKLPPTENVATKMPAVSLRGNASVDAGRSKSSSTTSTLVSRSEAKSVLVRTGITSAGKPQSISIPRQTTGSRPNSMIEIPTDRPTEISAKSRSHLPEPFRPKTTLNGHPVVSIQAAARRFGTPADSIANRTVKPPNIPPLTRVKLSAGPAPSPSKRAIVTKVDPKPRALSTPATIVAESKNVRQPVALPQRQSVLPHISSASTLSKPRAGSTAPKSTTSRLPAPVGKLSHLPTGGLASLWERLDRLQAKAGK